MPLKEAADFTHEPEVTIRALANRYQSDELPGRPGPPDLRSKNWNGAIASGGHLPADRLARILGDKGIVDAGVLSL
jgi:hypothetical protein